MPSLKIPNMLSYSRSINPSDALMFGIKEGTDIKKPVIVEERGSRSPFSSYSDSKKLEKNPARGNPKNSDVAFLPVGTDTLMITYSVAFNGNSLSPHACAKSGADVRTVLMDLAEGFKTKSGYRVLAKKYLDQILNGACAWRNLDGAEEVVVRAMSRKFGVIATSDMDGCHVDNNVHYEGLVDQIAWALENPKGIARINVEVLLPMHELAEVYPSETFITRDNGKGRTLSAREIETTTGLKRQGIIHAQKIGNAIRRIDDWYADGEVDPLAVEPFGIDRSLDRAVRIDAKRDFYTLLQKKTTEFHQAIEKAEDTDGIPDDAFYFMACLIRGGVFSAKEG